MTSSPDLIIVGAGPAGLSLAAALAPTDLSIVVIERADAGDLAQPAFDGREIALTLASRARLQDMGVWARLADHEIAPLKRAQVLDGASPFALHFDHRGGDGPLGFLVSNAALRRALYEAVCKQSNCEVIAGASAERPSLSGDRARIKLTDGRELDAALLIAADTRFSGFRKALGISAHMLEFGRTMLVCRVAHTRAHHSIATEWFDYGQTVAMLPLQPGLSSYVLTLNARDMAAAMAFSPEAFAQDAFERTQGRWGEMALQSTRHAYPLTAVFADRFIAPRFALLGDAAVGMHPVTAHGYNLGLAGAARLAKLIGEARRRGKDIGAAGLLSRYELGHRRISRPIFFATNAIARIYCDDRPLHRVARGSGLRLMHYVAPARHAVEGSLSAIGGR